jgi:hypothetical protein
LNPRDRAVTGLAILRLTGLGHLRFDATQCQVSLKTFYLCLLVRDTAKPTAYNLLGIVVPMVLIERQNIDMEHLSSVRIFFNCA